jgi:N-acetylmuramoyl-L-alanine amidase
MIALIPAHAPGPGAVYDPDGDGPLPVTQEAKLSAELCQRISALTGARIVDGTTRQERRKASALVPLPVVALEPHWNAGGGNYSAVFFAPWSAAGRAIAETIGQRLRNLGRFVRVLVEPADDRWPRVAGCLEYTRHTPDRHCGILVEVAFFDNPDHAWTTTPEGLDLIARAIAGGLEGV